jgi:hypothetical protein
VAHNRLPVNLIERLRYLQEAIVRRTENCRADEVDEQKKSSLPSEWDSAHVDPATSGQT